jgi:hypothetical protein
MSVYYDVVHPECGPSLDTVRFEPLKKSIE